MPSPHATQAPPAGPVVIVDDDSSCLTATDQVLRHWGYDTRTFSTFEDARAYLGDAQPSAVIVDVRLGAYNGLQLMHFTQAVSPQTPWFVVSGFDDPVLRQEASALGAHFLIKPLDLTQLRALLPPADVR